LLIADASTTPSASRLPATVLTHPWNEERPKSSTTVGPPKLNRTWMTYWSSVMPVTGLVMDALTLRQYCAGLPPPGAAAAGAAKAQTATRASSRDRHRRMECSVHRDRGTALRCPFDESGAGA
jgi:hypothetical protein